MQGLAVPDDVVEKAGSAPRVSFGSELFWRLLATLIFISVVWILWLLWQITPRSTVNPIVFQIQQNRQSASGLSHRITTGGQSGDSSQGAPLDNLKIETELKAPPKSARIAAKSAAK